jgi:hypothetical protein
MAIRTKTVRYSLGTTVAETFDINQCWVALTGGTAFTDRTSAINNATTADVPLPSVVDDAIYFGSTAVFACFSCDVSTAPSGGAAAWEYWNGTAWTTLTVTGGTLADNGTSYWDPPDTWATTSVNGSASLYYIRQRITTNRTTAGTASGINFGKMRTLSGTVYLPESGVNRTIRHAILRVGVSFNSVAAIEHRFMQGRWGSAAWATVGTRWTTTNNFVPAGETTGDVFQVDVTSAMTAAWVSSDTSKQYDFRICQCHRGEAAAGRHWITTGELFITYEYDDTLTTQLNTLVIPLDGLTADLTTTLQTVGGSGGVPQLTSSGFIKEASPTIRDCYFVLPFNTNEAGTTDWSLGLALDSESEATIGPFDAVNQSDYYMECIWRRADITTTAAHDLKMRVTNVAGATIAHAGALMVVTYEYDHASSTVLTHTDVIPAQVGMTLTTGTAATERTFKTVEFWVEGTNVGLLQSGAQITWQQSADPGTMEFAFGSQTARAYGATPADVSGPLSITQRFDAGGVAGSGISFARGKNTLTISARATTTPTVAGGVMAMIYVNYYYDKATNNRHNTAMFPAYHFPNFGTPAAASVSGSLRFYINEASYFISSAGAVVNELVGATQGSTTRLSVKIGDNLGWVVEGGTSWNTDANLGPRWHACEGLEKVKRWPTDPASNVVDPVAAACTASLTSTAREIFAYCWVNWHDYTFTTSLTISGSSGGTVDVEVRDDATEERLVTGSRTGDGTVSVTWYDNTRDVIATAKESTTKSGQSLTFKFGD